MKKGTGLNKIVSEIFCSFFMHNGKAGAVAATRSGLLQIWLPSETGRDGILEELADLSPAKPLPNELTDRAAALLQRYFSGERVAFELEIDDTRFSTFQRIVYAAVRKIPYGEVRTYAEIAAGIGVPNGARGVGAAMAANPLTIVIPCHRVVGSSGAMTGYSAPGGEATKKRLLAMEGLVLDGKGRVKLVRKK